MSMSKVTVNGFEFSLTTLIEFSSLSKLLLQLAMKTQSLQEQVDFLGGRIDDKDRRISELEIMLKGVSQAREEKFQPTHNWGDGKKLDENDYFEDQNQIQPPNEKSDIKDDISFPSSPKRDNEKSTINRDNEFSTINKDNIDKDNKGTINNEISADISTEKEKVKDVPYSSNMIFNDDLPKPSYQSKIDNLNEKVNENQQSSNQNQQNDTNLNDNSNNENKKENDLTDTSNNNNNNNIYNINTNTNNNNNDNNNNDNNNNENENNNNNNNNANTNNHKESVDFEPVPTDASRQMLGPQGSQASLTERTNQDNIPSPELIAMLFKKVKNNEKKIEELLGRTREHVKLNDKIKRNHEDIDSTNIKIIRLQKALDELNGKFKESQEDMENIKVKVQDFNIYDVFKSEGGEGGNIDATKALCMSLENKIFKKFSLIDERNKKNESVLFKASEDVKNMKNIVESVDRRCGKIEEKLEDFMKEYTENKQKTDDNINEANNQIDEIKAKLARGPDFKEFEAKLEKRLKDLEQKITTELSQKAGTGANMNGASLEQVKKNADSIRSLGRKLNELEKDIKITINNMSIETIKSKMFDLDSEMKKKCSKNEALEIYNRCKAVDDYTKDLNFKFEALQQLCEKLKSEMAQITKKIEFLSGEYSKLAFKNSKESSTKDNHPLIDLSKIVDTSTFEFYKKENSIKFDKIRQNFDEFARRIEEILERFTHTPTDKDFSEFQNLTRNLIEETKIASNKKYADKYEVNKTFKYLETQIKTVSDSYIKKAEGADNWLLAKKPIGNYMCASCESILKGNLDKNKDEYIPWNRYPSRADEKSYRIGHGFSRMLQLVNDDIMKTVEKGYSSDEEKKERNKSTDIGDSSVSQASGKDKVKDKDKERAQSNCVKLPKVKNRIINSTNLNIDDNSITMMDNNNPYSEKLNTSDMQNKPQIMKIYKLNKKSTNNSNLVSPNLQVNSLVINSPPNEGE